MVDTTGEQSFLQPGPLETGANGSNRMAKVQIKKEMGFSEAR